MDGYQLGSYIHLILVSPKEHISMPETPFVSLNVSHFAPSVIKTGFPDQGAIAKYPQVGLFSDEVLSFHCTACYLKENKNK